MDIIREALKEDIGSGDITTEAIVPKNAKAKAVIRSKAEGIIAGLNILTQIFKDKAEVTLHARDGDKVKSGDIIAEIRGSARHILAYERVALNFLQHLSGIATLAGEYVKAVHGRAAILDTRKTTPGLRALEKYAVRMGGAQNHRMGLYDMFLIKDNHIKIAGSAAKAVNLARKYANKRVEIEVHSTKEAEEAAHASPDMILLDNMLIAEMKKAVAVIRKINKEILIEASGNITLERAKEAAKIGLDFISVGALTHSAKALDLSLKIIDYETD